MNWLKNLKGKIKFNEPLNRYTSFKIGGNASILFEPSDTRDLINCLKEARKNKMPYFIIGNGTNLLVSDKGFKGVIIKFSSDFFRQINMKNNILTIGPGLCLNELVKFLSKTDFGGFEFLAGIPGTVGGALAMNAGVTIEGKRYNIGDMVYKIKALNKNGKIVNLSKNDCKFSYRKSDLNKYIIINAQLKLNTDRKSIVTNRIKDFLSYRKKRQDFSMANAGCIFKNPSIHLSAGALIDRCGLKGLRYGGAMISNKHANFILNFNRATANDVMQLIKIIKKKVQNSFGIELKEEIKIVS